MYSIKDLEELGILNKKDVIEGKRSMKALHGMMRTQFTK